MSQYLGIFAAHVLGVPSTVSWYERGQDEKGETLFNLVSMIFSDNPFSTCVGVSIRSRLWVFCCAKANPKFRFQCILVDASISETNGFPAYPQTPCQLPWTFLSHSPLIRNGGLKRSTPRLCLQALPGPDGHGRCAPDLE